MKRDDAMKMPCGECGAEAGLPCFGKDGDLRASVHRGRGHATTRPDLKVADRTAGKIEELLADGMRRAAELVQIEFDWASKYCESPIERLFLAALVHPMTASEFDDRLEMIRPKSGMIANAYPPPMAGIYVYPQITIGDYRVDFLLYSVSFPDIDSLIIELDGHEFHERTKEQAKRDKSRDRALVAQGYRVIRFTGSEIYADPMEAAREAISVLKRLQ